MTPERLAEIEEEIRAGFGTWNSSAYMEELRAALRAAWGERDAVRDAITTFTGVLVTDSGTVLSRRVRKAVDALVAVATGETPVVKEETP